MNATRACACTCDGGRFSRVRLHCTCARACCTRPCSPKGSWLGQTLDCFSFSFGLGLLLFIACLFGLRVGWRWDGLVAGPCSHGCAAGSFVGFGLCLCLSLQSRSAAFFCSPCVGWVCTCTFLCFVPAASHACTCGALLGRWPRACVEHGFVCLVYVCGAGLHFSSGNLGIVGLSLGNGFGPGSFIHSHPAGYYIARRYQETTRLDKGSLGFFTSVTDVAFLCILVAGSQPGHLWFLNKFLDLVSSTWYQVLGTKYLPSHLLTAAC